MSNILENFHQQFSEREILEFRVKAKNDLLWLLEAVLLPPARNAQGLIIDPSTSNDHELFRHLFRWMKHHEKSKNRLTLLPRSHRKTTYTTSADGLQIALPDDLGTAPYPRNLGPNVRIAIIHETDTMASKIMGEIKNWVQQNDLLRALFPDIIPEHRKRKDNESAFELRRTVTWREATFETMGVGTKGQGRHYNRLKLDDIYGTEARDSPSSRVKTIQWFDELEPFFVSPLTDGFDCAGTRYDSLDVYAHMMKKYGEDLPRYIRSIIEFNAATQRYEPIFPAMFTEDSIKHLRKNRKVWTANYLNAPDFRTDRDLKPEWIREFHWLDKDKRTLVAFTPDGRLKRHVDSLDKLLFIDPALEGDAGWVITGCDNQENHPNIFCLESYRGPIPPEVIIPKIFEAVQKWNLRAVVIEEVLFSRLYRHWLEAEMRHRNFYFNIIPVKTGGQEKDARVLALAPFFESGQIFFEHGAQALREEYDAFGTGRKYHILDALAYGPANWRASVDYGATVRRRAADEKMLQFRNRITGYTRTGTR